MNPIGAVQRYAIIALVLIIAGGLFGGWQRHEGNKHGEVVGINSCAAAITTGDRKHPNACTDAADQANAAALAKFEAAARVKEQAAAVAMTQIQNAYYQQGVTDANAKADAVVAGLRAGNLRLRQRWICPATARVLETGAGAGEPDAAADDRAASAARIVRAAAQADAKIRALQAVVSADRKFQ